MEDIKLTKIGENEYAPVGKKVIKINNRIEKIIEGKKYVNTDPKYGFIELQDYFGKDFHPSEYAVWEIKESDLITDAFFNKQINNQRYSWRKYIIDEFTPFGIPEIIIWDFARGAGYDSTLSQCMDEISTNPMANIYLNLHNENIIDESVIQYMCSAKDKDNWDQEFNYLKNGNIFIPIYYYGFNNCIYFSVSIRTFLLMDITKMNGNTLEYLKKRWSNLIPSYFFERAISDTERLKISLDLFKIKTNLKQQK